MRKVNFCTNLIQKPLDIFNANNLVVHNFVSAVEKWLDFCRFEFEK